MRLAPTAIRIGIPAAITSAGTIKTPPPRPEIAPTKPAPIARRSNPVRISSTFHDPAHHGFAATYYADAVASFSSAELGTVARTFFAGLFRHRSAIRSEFTDRRAGNSIERPT